MSIRIANTNSQISCSSFSALCFIALSTVDWKQYLAFKFFEYKENRRVDQDRIKHQGGSLGETQECVSAIQEEGL